MVAHIMYYMGGRAGVRRTKSNTSSTWNYRPQLSPFRYNVQDDCYLSFSSITAIDLCRFLTIPSCAHLPEMCKLIIGSNSRQSGIFTSIISVYNLFQTGNTRSLYLPAAFAIEDTILNLISIPSSSCERSVFIAGYLKQLALLPPRYSKDLIGRLGLAS